MSAEHALYDRNGIPILPGDTVKVFHYVAAVRRERRFMYKYVAEIANRNVGAPMMKWLHLNLKGEWYWMVMDGRVLSDCEIVQGYGGVASGDDYRDRKRKAIKTLDTRIGP